MVDINPLSDIIQTPPDTESLKRFFNAVVGEVDIQPSWHPLGFVHAELGRFEGLTYRLHLWPLQERKPKTPNWSTHNHAFDLTSRILAGVITDKHYEFTEERADYRLYRVDYVPSGSRILRTERKGNLLLINEASYGRGSRYSVRAGEFHCSSVAENAVAATLVRTSNHRNEPPYVVGDLDCAAEYSYYREPVEHGYFVELCRRILA